jgi:dipeptidyl-peptidase-4
MRFLKHLTTGLPTLAAVFALLAIVPDSTAQEATDPGKVTLDRMFGSGDFFPEFPGRSRWLEDGSAYTTLERSEAGPGRDLVKYDAASGEREVLVSAAQLVPEGATRPLGIQNYEWSPDGSKLLIYTNSKRVWRFNSRGDYWVLDLETRALRQMGSDRPESSLMYGKFDPSGDRFGYVSKNDLFVEDVATGEVTRLTDDGSETLINGNFDWVYEEEFFMPLPADGWRWAPDGESIAYWQLDAEGIGVFDMINNTDSVYSFTIPVQYPKVGTQNSAARIGVVSAGGGSTVWCDVPGDQRDNYIPRMEWSGNGNEVAIQRMNRHQNINNVMLCDAEDGSIRTLLTETDAAYLDAIDDWIWLGGDERMTWISERTGWRHIYTVDRESGELDPITSGDWEVVNIELIDEDGGWIYFNASPNNATQRYLYRVPLGGGDPVRLSPADQPGTHTYSLSPDGSFAIHTYSTLTTPPVVSLVSLPDHAVLRVLVDNARLNGTLAELDRGRTELFQIDVGDAMLDAWIMYPPDFDPNLKYPVLFYAYSAPFAQTVLDRWDFGNFGWHTMLTQQGYIVASVDNRGTPGPRGHDWRKAQYRKTGRVNSADQAAAALKLSERPYVDASRIGMWGWSGGGGATLNALFRYPEIYSTGIAVAAVTNLENYDTIYMERYMGLIDENPEDYFEGSAINFASGLEGNLLYVHGTGDDNVHYQNAEQLFNELIKHNKYFTMLAYPNRSHGIFEGPGTRKHLFTYMTRYLNEHMPPGGVPQDEATSD